MDAIIFDVDGTLWDSRVPVAHAWNHSIERLTGKPSSFTPEYLGQFFGKTMDVIVQVLLPDCPPEERLRLGEQIFREENDWLEQEPGTLYPGVEETLAELGRRWPLYIVSNCQILQDLLCNSKIHLKLILCRNHTDFAARRYMVMGLNGSGLNYTGNRSRYLRILHLEVILVLGRLVRNPGILRRILCLLQGLLGNPS